MQPIERPKAAIVIAAVALCIVVIVASESGATRTATAGSEPISSGLTVAGGPTLTSLLSTYCLNSTPSAYMTQTVKQQGYTWTETAYMYGPKNASSPATCNYARWGIVNEIFNQSHNGILQDEMFSDYQVYNATTEYFTASPILGTSIPGLEEWKITHNGKGISFAYCPNQVCGGNSPAGGGASPSSSCAVATSYSTGIFGWGLWINQCGWQWIYNNFCIAPWNGWSEGGVLALLAIIFGGTVGAAGALGLALDCAMVWFNTQSPNGATIMGYTGWSCFWSWTQWNWICVSYTVFAFTAWGGPWYGF